MTEEAEKFNEQLEEWKKREMTDKEKHEAQAEMVKAHHASLRDQFAMAAVPAILADKSLRIPDGIEPEELLATMAYCLADAMMKEREKSDG